MKNNLKKWIDDNEDSIRDMWSNTVDTDNVLVIYDYNEGWTVDSVHAANVGLATIQIPAQNKDDIMDGWDIIDECNRLAGEN